MERVRRCFGITGNIRNFNLNRCGRTGDWRLYCHEHRRQPLYWLFVCTIGIAAIVADFSTIINLFKPPITAREPSPAPKSADRNLEPTLPEQKKHKTLLELFHTDFQKLRLISTYQVIIENKIEYNLKYIIWGDFNTGTVFFSVFFPESDYTFYVCKYLIPKYREILNGNIQKLMQNVVNQPPGARRETLADLSFSGRVYIYHETFLSSARIESLEEEYKKADLYPHFRGRDYLIMRNSPLYEQ